MAQTNEQRDLAVMTIVQDEPEFIHPWLNHYKGHVADSQDIFVLVHSRNRTEKPVLVRDIDGWERAETALAGYHGVSTLPVHHASSFDHRWLLHTIECFFSFLLKSYKWVLFAEVDELVLPMPGVAPVGQTLLGLVRDRETDSSSAIRATGFEIVQQPGERSFPPALYRDGGNVTLSVAQMIQNRGSWYRSELYSKTVLAKIPLTWDLGFHKSTGVAANVAHGAPTSDLVLVHLKKIDFELALNRSRRARAKNWSEFDVKAQLGWQNRIQDVEELRAFWEKDGDTERPFAPGRLEPIPPDLKRALR
jgi:hypothetical protein